MEITENLKPEIQARTSPDGNFKYISVKVLSIEVYYTKDFSKMNISLFLEMANKNFTDWFEHDNVQTETHVNPRGIYIEHQSLKKLIEWLPESAGNKLLKVYTVVSACQMYYPLIKYRNNTIDRQDILSKCSSFFNFGDTKKALEDAEEIFKCAMSDEKTIFKVYEYLVSIGQLLERRVEDLEARSLSILIYDMIQDSLMLCRDIVTLLINIDHFLTKKSDRNKDKYQELYNENLKNGLNFSRKGCGNILELSEHLSKIW